MTDLASDRDPLEEMAEEFVARYRRGERPSLTEFAVRRPDLADRVRDLFPALILIEQLNPSPPAGRPDRLGEYRIVREIGRGGMGVVYEAVQESLGRRVALKVLPADRNNGPFLERFRREARAAAGLHHTNIVPVFGVGEHNGTHFYVMQYIEGRGLDDVLRDIRQLRDAERPIEPTTQNGPKANISTEEVRHAKTSESGGAKGATSVHRSSHAICSTDVARSVARLGVQAAEALHHAHNQGVFHRDVKPSNLLLDEQGTLWIADFGLAKAEDSADLTHSNDLVGTLRYMAPERFRGVADARSDVYSLGATLYELVAQRPPFDGPDRLGLMDRIAHGAPTPLSQVDPTLPRDLETIIGKALANDRRDRYATAGEMADDLRLFLADRPIRARRANWREHAWRWAKRRPAVAALAAAVIVLLAASAGGGWWAAGLLRDQVRAVSAAEGEKTERLWEARLALARAGRASRLPGQRVKSLDAIAEAAAIRPSLELRNEAVACLALVDVRIDRTWAEAIETDRLNYSTGAAFDPDLVHYAFTDPNGTIHVRSVEDGRELARLSGGRTPADYLRFSPDGRYLAARYTQVGQPFCVWDWRAGTPMLTLSEPGLQMPAFDFRPDSRAVAVGSDRGLGIYSLPDGRQLLDLTLNFVPGWLSYEPRTGDQLAVCGSAKPLLVTLDADTGTVRTTWRSPAMLYAVAWEPGGGLLAASGRDGHVYTFDVTAGAPREPLIGHQLEAREVAFSPDGTLLVTRGWDATTRFWDPHGGTELLRVRGKSFLQFSRDGRRLAFRGYNSREFGIWDLPRPEVRVLYGHRPQIHAGDSFAPGGRLLATAAGDGVCLWDVRAGRLLERLDTGPARDVLIDPRGRWLLTGGDRGVLRFPLSRESDANEERWRIGRSTGVTFAGQPYQLHFDGAGEQFLVSQRGSQVLLYRADGWLNWPRRLTGHTNVSYAAFSPDGRYVATGTWRGTGVRVWDAESGRQVAALPASESAGVGFTPDGSRLLVLESEGAYRIYRVPDWQLTAERHDPDTGFTRGLRAAFHPDGRTMAHTQDRVNLRLVDLETGGELCVLPVPESQNLAAYQFSPDGRHLAAVTVRGVVQLWDLHSLRARLRELGLDWTPPQTPADADGGRPVTVKVRIDAGG
jgi:serine/threonine protein kinase/WD40 repeat protein